MKSVSPLFVKRVKHLFTAVLLVICPNSCRICLCETRETICSCAYLVDLPALRMRCSYAYLDDTAFDLHVLRRRETSRGKSKKPLRGSDSPKRLFSIINTMVNKLVIFFPSICRLVVFVNACKLVAIAILCTRCIYCTFRDNGNLYNIIGSQRCSTCTIIN